MCFYFAIYIHSFKNVFVAHVFISQCYIPRGFSLFFLACVCVCSPLFSSVVSLREKQNHEGISCQKGLNPFSDSTPILLGISVEHVFTYCNAIAKRFQKYSLDATANRNFGFTYIPGTLYMRSENPRVCVSRYFNNRVCGTPHIFHEYEPVRRPTHACVEARFFLSRKGLYMPRGFSRTSNEIYVDRLGHDLPL